MPRNWFRAVAWLILALAAAPSAAAPPARANGSAPDPVRYERCFADGTRADSLTASHQWTCGEASHSIAAERVFIRFEIAPNSPQPSYLEARRAAFAEGHVLLAGADGSTRLVRFNPADLESSRRGGHFRFPLPALEAPVTRVVAAFDLPTHRMTLEKASLVAAGAHDFLGAHRLLLVVAALCGMLLMPLMFNVAFYRILRERFVLWHSALAITLLLSVVVGSGLSFYLGNIPVMTLSAINTLLFGFSVGAAGMFAHSFIEPDKLDPLLRRALRFAAGWAVLCSTLHAVFPFVLRPVQSDLYYVAYVPVLAVYVLVLVDALRRGSRAARFQALGWGPMVVVCLVRLVSGLVPSIPNNDAMLLFYAGCVVEVLATTLGVADRFMAIKDQRDRARTEARVLESLSERDALTGLLNRRVIEDRFTTLRAEGFTTIAVLDLDHFKRINDHYGHTVGDEVLRVVARALQPDDDTLVLRMGGEEFLLLLRGKDAKRRAEARRQAIAVRVAQEIEGLDRPQTASMGLVEAPPETLPNTSFADLYARADRLLYDAKQAGRNRTLSERLKLFVPRRKERRKGRAAA